MTAIVSKIISWWDGSNDLKIDYAGPVRVEAQISAELVNLRIGATEWTGNAPQILNVDNRNVDSVVRAMNGAVQNGIDQLTASLNQRFSVSGSR